MSYEQLWPGTDWDTVAESEIESRLAERWPSDDWWLPLPDDDQETVDEPAPDHRNR